MGWLHFFLPLALAFTASAAAPAWVPAQFLSDFPANAAVRGAAIDSAGNVVLVGVIGSVNAGVYRSDGFAATYSPDGLSRISYLLLRDSSAIAVTTDGAGNAYIAGNTVASDFPATGGQGAAFVVKLDGEGNVVYSTRFGGPTANPYPSAIAVNRAGEAFVTGQNAGGMPVSEGGIAGTGRYFTVRLSAAGDRVIYSITGAGGTAIAVDAEDNAYTVSTPLDSDVPITDNAIQKTVPFTVCSGNRAFVFPCTHQYVAKVNASGTKLLFATWVSGSYGETGSSIALDAHGDIYLAGTTNSADYPVTEGALQPRDLTVIPPPPVYHEFFFEGLYEAFPITGFVTRLAGDGSGVLYSTYLGGTQIDSVLGMTVDADGQATVAMRVQSPDLPGLPQLPPRCLPDRLHATPVLVSLDAQGAAVRSATVISGVAPGASAIAAFDAAGGAVLAGDGPFLAGTIAGAPPADALVCMTDQADYVQTKAIAPGQLLTLFGNAMAASEQAYDANADTLPSNLGGATVLVDGIAAPMLYASAGQINFVMPYEIAGRPAVSLELITAAGGHARRTLPVAAASPALITLGETDYPACRGQTVEGSEEAVVLNADGTRNSCEHPAAEGSVVSVFLTGAGGLPSGVTGLNRAGGLPLDAELYDGYGNQVLRAFAVDWAPLGVWQVEVQVHQPNLWVGTTVSASAIQLVVNGVAARTSPVAVWLR